MDSSAATVTAALIAAASATVSALITKYGARNFWRRPSEIIQGEGEAIELHAISRCPTEDKSLNRLVHRLRNCQLVTRGDVITMTAMMTIYEGAVVRAEGPLYGTGRRQDGAACIVYRCDPLSGDRGWNGVCYLRLDTVPMRGYWITRDFLDPACTAVGALTIAPRGGGLDRIGNAARAHGPAEPSPAAS